MKDVFQKNTETHRFMLIQIVRILILIYFDAIIILYFNIVSLLISYILSLLIFKLEIIKYSKYQFKCPFLVILHLVKVVNDRA